MGRSQALEGWFARAGGPTTVVGRHVRGPASHRRQRATPAGAHYAGREGVTPAGTQHSSGGTRGAGPRGGPTPAMDDTPQGRASLQQ